MQATDTLMDTVALGKMVFGLLIVLALMGALVVLVRFLQQKNLSLSGHKERVKIVQTVPLGVKQKLAIVQWKESQYLIGLSPSGGFLIDEKPLKKPELYKKMTGKDA